MASDYIKVQIGGVCEFAAAAVVGGSGFAPEALCDILENEGVPSSREGVLKAIKAAEKAALSKHRTLQSQKPWFIIDDEPEPEPLTFCVRQGRNQPCRWSETTNWDKVPSWAQDGHVYLPPEESWFVLYGEGRTHAVLYEDGTATVEGPIWALDSIAWRAAHGLLVKQGWSIHGIYCDRDPDMEKETWVLVGWANEDGSITEEGEAFLRDVAAQAGAPADLIGRSFQESLDAIRRWGSLPPSERR